MRGPTRKGMTIEKSYSREDYRNALRRHADSDGYIGSDRYDQERDDFEPSKARFLQVYGRWNDAVLDAGLVPHENLEWLDQRNNAMRFSGQDCIEALQRCAADLGQATISFSDYNNWRKRGNRGYPSSATVRTRLGDSEHPTMGSWSQAITAAGMEPFQAVGTTEAQRSRAKALTS